MKPDAFPHPTITHTWMWRTEQIVLSFRWGKRVPTNWNWETRPWKDSFQHATRSLSFEQNVFWLYDCSCDLPAVYGRHTVVSPCHHGMARSQIADVGTSSNMEGKR